MGVPHELLRVAELGGTYVTRVVGALPVIVVEPLEVTEPPVILAFAPAVPVPSSDHTVTKVNTVLLVAVA